MSIELSTPSEDLARRLTEEAPYEQRLMGIKMSAMGGGNPTPLYTLAQVAHFIHVGNYEEIALATRGATVGYVDPATLADWLGNIPEDQELAEAVRELIATGEVYGKLAPQLKALLQKRVEQISSVLDPQATETSETEEVAAEA